MAQQSILQRQNAVRHSKNPFTDAAAVESTERMDQPTLNTLLPKGHKLLTYNDSEQYATAAANLHTLKKAIHRAGYDKGYKQAREDAEKLTDEHVEALLQMGRDLGWEEATDFYTSERAKLRIRNEATDGTVRATKIELQNDEPIRAVHWFRCAKKCLKAARAKVAKAKARGGKVAYDEEKEWFGFSGR